MSASIPTGHGHLMCAIDTETTGLDPKKNEIWQIAILPLNSLFKPHSEYIPFYMDIKITRPDNIDKNAVKMNKVEFAKRQQRATDPFTAADMFDTWFDSLHLPIYKKIIPLAQNWPFDREFIIEWLGRASFEYSFNPVYRDTMTVSAFIRDQQDLRSEKIRFPQNNLTFLCARLGVKNQKPHDALQDAIVTAEVYRRLLMLT